MTAFSASDKLKVGDPAPDFTLPADHNHEISLAALKGKKVVLYFYPKDDTPGCTKESCDFRDNMILFSQQDIQIIGISKDSAQKHDKFKEKYNLNFPLVSDESGDVCKKYGVWVEKSMYGRKYMGIDRSTFLIDEEGKILEIWRNVKVSGHVETVMDVAGKKSKAA
ncbi:MAG: thioredoxin-dependent thiol peroxidase [Alphaproteobacteria bacterium CG_4_9_14_3_um_filter_47_13]|nr:MAG: thioredoxin-dependent thiol peroxidase [Alphaproteobacteria bacterium CG_4_9_14_3_um_filter_47_13]